MMFPWVLVRVLQEDAISFNSIDALFNPLDAGELFCLQISYNLDMLWTVEK